MSFSDRFFASAIFLIFSKTSSFTAFAFFKSKPLSCSITVTVVPGASPSFLRSFAGRVTWPLAFTVIISICFTFTDNLLFLTIY